MPVSSALSDPSHLWKQKFMSGLKSCIWQYLCLVVVLVCVCWGGGQHWGEGHTQVRIICYWGHISTIFVLGLLDLTCTPLLVQIRSKLSGLTICWLTTLCHLGPSNPCLTIQTCSQYFWRWLCILGKNTYTASDRQCLELCLFLLTVLWPFNEANIPSVKLLHQAFLLHNGRWQIKETSRKCVRKVSVQEQLQCGLS